jgi:hypothetical protein
MTAASAFLELRSFDAFDRVVDPSVFTPAADDDVLGISDVVQSTEAIARGGYKAVNMAGAAIITAIMNALGHRNFPFVFGGDGAAFVVGAADAGAARTAAARTRTWVADELALDLRVAAVPVRDIRAAGHDVRVGRFAASPHVSYAMLSGGGVEWAERELKAGRIALPPSPPRIHPDLSGLSCRWEPIASRHGVILSLIVREAPGAPPGAFADLVRRLLALIAGDTERDGHPVPAEGPRYRFSGSGFGLEVRSSKGARSLVRRTIELAVHAAFSTAIFKSGLRIGRFDPAHYRRELARNTDFRKFDDGLRMTVDCEATTAGRIEAMLADARETGIVRFGTHRQPAALMTCIVPSPLTDDHLHFLDGADGGYAAAARALR